MSNTEHHSPQPLQIAGIEISVAEQTPLVLALVAVIQRQQLDIQGLRDEVHRFKGTTQRPKIEPSRLLKSRPTGKTGPQKKRPGSAKRQKTKDLKIDETVPLYLDDLPAGTRLEGYRDFVVQDLVIKTHNVRYRRAVYRLPDGSVRVAPRPDDVDGHFGVGLREHVLWQVHQNHVTQGRLLEELHELGIDISAGKISDILLQGHDALHAEKDELLPVARQISGYLHCDDTSARHRGQAAVCRMRRKNPSPNGLGRLIGVCVPASTLPTLGATTFTVEPPCSAGWPMRSRQIHWGPSMINDTGALMSHSPECLGAR